MYPTAESCGKFHSKNVEGFNSTAAKASDAKSSLEVKHLPVSATAAELRERFARFGALVRCTLAPSNTVRVANEKTDKVQITSL